MIRFRHQAVDDVDHKPVSVLNVRQATGDNSVLVTITAFDDPDIPVARHWLTPIAAAELAKALKEAL